MPKVLVAGHLGRMGQAALWACRKLGFETEGFDIDGSANYFRTNGLKNHADILISCMPYHQNLTWAKQCIDEGVSYIDLGGRVDVDHQINEYASKNTLKRSIHTSAGLAPGLVNIMAECGFSMFPKATTVKMYCGGLPEANINPIGYLCNWSIDGLINEYKDSCETLKDSKIVTMPGMSELDLIKVDGIQYEAFNTSGGACHSLRSFKQRGVQNCSYKTLRYPGHRDLVQYLLEKLNKEEFGKLVESKTKFEDNIIVGVIVQNIMTDECYGKTKRISCSKRFTAMQRSTAFSLVSAAKVVLGHSDPKILTYKDFNNPQFFETFEFLLGEDK